MATTGTFTAQGNIVGGPGPQESFGPWNQPFTAAIGTSQSVALVNGNVSVTVPANSTLMMFAPPNAVNPTPNPAYAGTITLKGVNGDTGTPLSITYRTYVPWDTATTPASVVFAATAAGTGTVTFW